MNYFQIRRVIRGQVRAYFNEHNNWRKLQPETIVTGITKRVTNELCTRLGVEIVRQGAQSKRHGD